MAKTYRLSDANSDLAIGGAFTDTLTTAAAGSNTITAAQAGGVASGYYAAGANDPNSSGTSTGTFTTVLNVSAAVSSTQARCYLLRVNSSGVTQAEVVSPTGYVSTATTGDKTWSWTDPALGTWAAGDRVALRVEVQNNNAHGGAAGPTFSHTSANTRVDTPFVNTVTGAVVLPITVDRLALGRVTAKSAVVSPLAFGFVVNGTRTRFGAVVLPLAWNTTTEGRRERLGAVVTPIVFGFFTDGAVDGGGPADWFGAVSLPLTFTVGTNGTRTRLGATTLPLTFTATSDPTLELLARLTLPLVWGSVVSGIVGDIATPPEVGKRRRAIVSAPGQTLASGATGKTRATVLTGVE